MAGDGKARSGFTTGTCAAAAARAAARALFSGICEESVPVVLPSRDTAVFPIVETAFLTDGGRPVEPETLHGDRMAYRAVRCAVQKDAGDDPDVTDGVLVFAVVGKAECISEGRPAGRPGIFPCYREESGLPLLLSGGEGIGLVTREGLSCPVGYPAMNPVPRRMIFAGVDEVLRELLGADWPQSLGRGEALYIEISIPAGVGLAAKTFNPNLGIRGGISVLGTTGIVNPMSEPALVETIRLDIRVRAAEGRTVLAVAPGNYGESFLRENLGLSMDAFVKCSNFVGDTFRMMGEEGICEVLLAGHLGKLVKVAGGVLNTHSRYGDRRMEILSDLAREAGAGGEAARLLAMNTAEEAAQYLNRAGCLDPVMNLAARRVREVLERHGGIHTEVVIFTQRLGILSMTEGAKRLAQKLRLAGNCREGGGQT